MPSEKRVPVQTYEVHLFCDCGGEMEPTGQVLTSYPPQYPHRCISCGEQVIKDKAYPCIEYDAAQE